MHCDYPQGGSLTVPERDISAIIAFGVLGRGVGSGKCLIPGSILRSSALLSLLPASKADSYSLCQGHSVCPIVFAVSEVAQQLRGPLLGETNKRQTPFPWPLKDDVCFMSSGLKRYVSGFLQQTP